MHKDTVAVPAQEIRIDQHIRQEDSAAVHIKGEVFMTLKSSETGEILETRHNQNLIVKDASILLARLVKNAAEPTTGLFCLAVGTGDSGWDLQNPPAATVTQRALYGELSRKTFSSTTFIDSASLPTVIPTNVVDFTTTFGEAEAVGALCEMGLLGGTISSNLNVKNPVTPANGPYNVLVDHTTKETMFNYLTFKVLNKPPTSTLTLTWRLTF